MGVVGAKCCHLSRELHCVLLKLSSFTDYTDRRKTHFSNNYSRRNVLVTPPGEQRKRWSLVASADNCLHYWPPFYIRCILPKMYNYNKFQMLPCLLFQLYDIMSMVSFCVRIMYAQCYIFNRFSYRNIS